MCSSPPSLAPSLLRVVALAFALLTAAPLANAAPRADDAVDDFVATVMHKLHVPGMGVAIVRAGKIEKLRAYGLANLEWRAPVSATTRFQLASTTKLFTGTLLMRLVQDGKIALADPVATYLPDAPPAWKNITVAQLAAHASGIAGGGDPRAATVSVADAYRAARARPLAYAPGAHSDYGGGDFDVLAYLLERVGGQPFPELLRTRVWQPLDLKCTTFDDATQDGLMRTARVVPERASVYGFSDGQLELQWFLFPAHTYAMGGA
ncbi:MAG TPA: serine hydrolase domain-containing protein [Polyangia bacterium]|nr:serine hydrolase domain-containing protein [Polyangia bacterium]